MIKHVTGIRRFLLRSSDIDYITKKDDLSFSKL
jgi:hypothetical protein